MWMRFGSVAFAACLMPASSCAATKCGDYKHLEFQPVQGMTVVETRVPALSGLKDVKPFPISYVVKRESYQIVARVYERDYGPTATLSVEAKAPMALKVSNMPPAAAGTGCVVQVEQGGSVKFSWLGKTGCVTSQSISVAVINATGAQVAIEELPFTVVTNGKYCVKDGL